jgi:hypothetical protein
MECLLKQFYNPKVNETINSLEIPERYLLSSELINIVSHYRHFFWSRYGTATNYYVYYSSEKAVYNGLLVDEYRKQFYEKRIDNSLEYGSLNRMVRENLKLANVLSEYLPNIYFIDTKDMEPSVLAHYIMKNNQEDTLTNIVFSNNVVDHQLVNNDRTFVITMQSDKSKVIRKENLMDSLLKDSKKKSSTVLSSHLFVPVLALSGHKGYSVEGLKGMGKIKAVATLEKGLLDGTVSNTQYKSMSPITKGTLSKPDAKLVDANFNVLDYENQSQRISPKQLDNLKSQIDNKSDNQSLMEINHTYYEKYPLQIIELFEGE